VSPILELSAPHRSENGTPAWQRPAGLRRGPTKFAQLTAPRPPARSFSEVADFGDLRIQQQEFGHGLHLRTKDAPSKILVGLIENRSASVAQRGNAWTPQEIALVRRGGLDLYTLGPSAFIWIEAESALLGDALEDSSLSTESAAVVQASPAALDALRGVCVRALQPRDGRNRRAGTDWSTRQEVLRAAARALRFGGERAVEPTALERYLFAKRVEDFMWRNLDEPMALPKIADAMSCSVRRLIYCFNRVYGLGPIGYFKIQRLNAVCEELASAPDRRTILDVAADYGFWHLGHFGADYKALFGLTPSQTRRQGLRLASLLP